MINLIIRKSLRIKNSRFAVFLYPEILNIGRKSLTPNRRESKITRFFIFY